MAELSGRALMESRFGPLGSGVQNLIINAARYTVAELMVRMGLHFDDRWSIDALALPHGNYVIRYFDAQDQRVVALEFDAELRFLAETRVHIAEWEGEKAYFSPFGGH
jgi:hypothetical protein